MRFAVHLDRLKEINAPPKPKTAANTSKPPVPPCASRTPNTFSMMNSTKLSRASTARFVTIKRKMRFISPFFEGNNHNMLADTMVGTLRFDFKDYHNFRECVAGRGSPYPRAS